MKKQGGGPRALHTRVKKKTGLKESSRRWLERHLNDPYVHRAKAEGWRSRAAFKLIEIDDRHHILKPGMRVIDLGAAPGGWCQVAEQKGCKPIVAIDLLAVDDLPGVDFIQMDFMDDSAPQKLKDMLGGPADVVLSDMAPNTIGHRQTDHLRIMAVVEAAYMFACEVLVPGGAFVAKVFQGGAQNTLISEMNQRFEKVRHIKPPASRKDSSEQYLVATGFKG